MVKEFIITEGDIDSVVDSLLAEAPPLSPRIAAAIQAKLDNIASKIESGDNAASDMAELKTAVLNAPALSDEQKQEIISKIERLFPRFDKEEADIEIYDWGSTKGKGGVSVVDGFKYKGSSKNTTSEKFIEMYINNKIATAMIDKLEKAADFDLSDTPAAGTYDKESFFEKFVLPKDAEWDNLSYTAKIIGEIDLAEKAEKTKEDGGLTPEQKRELEEKEREAKDAFETLANLLKDKKEELNKNHPEFATKFNNVKEDYNTEMAVLFRKKFAEYLTSPPAPIPESLQEGYLHNITIDFSEIRRKQKHLDESFLVMFGSWVQWLLGKMFGGGSIPGTIKGSKSEVESFARAMGSEKRYIETAKRYGLDHPTTYKNKAKLSSATKNFEKATGIKWPFE